MRIRKYLYSLYVVGTFLLNIKTYIIKITNQNILLVLNMNIGIRH